MRDTQKRYKIFLLPIENCFHFTRTHSRSAHMPLLHQKETFCAFFNQNLLETKKKSQKHCSLCNRFIIIINRQQRILRANFNLTKKNNKTISWRHSICQCRFFCVYCNHTQWCGCHLYSVERYKGSRILQKSTKDQNVFIWIKILFTT